MQWTLVLLGFLSALSVFVVMWRINIRRFMGYPVICDVTVCVALGLALHGSFGGMAAAIIGSLFFSAGIWCLRHLVGYERYVWRVGWVRQPGLMA